VLFKKNIRSPSWFKIEKFALGEFLIFFNAKKEKTRSNQPRHCSFIFHHQTFPLDYWFVKLTFFQLLTAIVLHFD
jgi:hypothetical protein